MSRKIVILDNNSNLPKELKSASQSGKIYLQNLENSIDFNQAHNLLGSENNEIIFDIRANNKINFNLEAFAICTGTIKENGKIYLLCDDFDNLENTFDLDSLRWNDGKLIPCTNFYKKFKKLCKKFSFTKQQSFNFITKPKVTAIFKLSNTQNLIIQQLPQNPNKIHLITAQRGRGKSTTAKHLAQNFAKNNQVIFTTQSKMAKENFKDLITSKIIKFINPENLIQQIENNKIAKEQILFIEEASNLPIYFIKKCCEYFHKIILIATTENYEGTGSGFNLKLKPLLGQNLQTWQLHQPLRWQANDPLENFMNQLLLINKEKQNLTEKFYRLLKEYHYKTTISDLRRLYDGSNHTMYLQDNAGLWAIVEGGLTLKESYQIWQGNKWLKGNLVSQYLTAHLGLVSALYLRSIRISRLVVAKIYQNQGIGKTLVKNFINKYKAEKTIDFISVSFGAENYLIHFWQKLGFKLIHQSQTKDACSGLNSILMLYPLSEKGTKLVDFATRQFQTQNNKFTKWDHNNLYGFAKFNRSLNSVMPSLNKLLQIDANFAEKLNLYLLKNKNLSNTELKNLYKKLISQWLNSVH